MDDPERHIRATRHSLPIAHAEAFQLMRYDPRKGGGESVWFWNSRDGVTPFGTMIDGVEYQHAMGAYRPSYWAMLPALASRVWVTYDRAAWLHMQREKWRNFSARTDEYGADFRERYPLLANWEAVVPFEHGQPRQLSRAEFLASTPEWMGRADG